MSRVDNLGRNVIWQVAASILSTVLGFASRFFFMWMLGEEYLGIGGLFQSIVLILTFADLGLTNAYMFCFYKPIARGDTQHIQALLRSLRKLLRYVMLFIAVAGLALLPFLRYFVTGADNIDDAGLRIYYLITLANTLLGYWVAYKVCYITAKQQYYTIMPITILANLATVVLQIVAMFATTSYMTYVLVGLGVRALQMLATSLYIRRKFPETNNLPDRPLPAEDKQSIVSNIKGIFVRKVGDLAITQTDNIIVSVAINIATTGLLSNYFMIKTAVLDLISMIQNSLTAGMGDLAASEDDKVQLDVFYTYMMLNYIVMGFAMCGVGVLSTPFIAMLFGPDKTIDPLSVALMCISFYITYQTYALNVLPTARGKYMVGAYVSIVEAGVNLAVSLIAVQFMGLAGVFLGTLASAIIAYILRPVSVFKKIYHQPPKKYYATTIKYFVVALVTYGVLYWLGTIIIGDGVNGIRFIALGAVTVLGYFGVTWLVWGRETTFKTCLKLIREFAHGLLVKEK